MTPWRVALAVLAPASASADGWCPPPHQIERQATDDFRQGVTQWRIEAQDPRTEVKAEQGVLRWHAPAGLSLWWHAPLKGDWAVRFTATPLPAPESAGPKLAGRVSDLNMFWNASDADAPASLPRSRDGAFKSHDTLRAYYAGFGANGNTTTRWRRYDGKGQRVLLDGFADPPEAEPGDRRGPMTPATRLSAGQPIHVQIVSRQPTPADPITLRWSANGHELFAWSDPQPLLAGGFALRSTASAFEIRDFQVLGCRAPR